MSERLVFKLIRWSPDSGVNPIREIISCRFDFDANIQNDQWLNSWTKMGIFEFHVKSSLRKPCKDHLQMRHAIYQYFGRKEYNFKFIFKLQSRGWSYLSINWPVLKRVICTRDNDSTVVREEGIIFHGAFVVGDYLIKVL